MHERRFQGDIDRLRSPERIALLEVDRVVDLSLEDLQAASLLDVGTGSGLFAEAFAGKVGRIAGIDPNPGMIKKAGSFVPSGEFVEGTVEAIPFGDRSFDVVFLGHVLHESDDIVTALTESRRVAKRRVCVLEWPYIDEAAGPPLGHRLEDDRVRLAARQAGFSRVEQVQLRHMVLFRLTV